MWGLFEPVHALPYFLPEQSAALSSIGLDSFYSGYFAARSAPLGAVGPAAVTAVFYNFSPRMVEQHIPAAWRVAAPDKVLNARLEGAVGALRTLGPVARDEPRIAAAADLAWTALDAAEVGGRALGAANIALARPAEPLAALWQAATALRELRGDCHVAALLAAGVTGLESLVLRVGSDLPEAPYQSSREWTDEEWSGAIAGLAGRGLADDSGRTTARGQQILDEVEKITDRLSAQPWTAIGDEATRNLADLMRPLARAIIAVWPEKMAIGLPDPG
jgi:hypothetical protein